MKAVTTIHRSVHRIRPSVVLAAAAVIGTLCLLYEAGAQSKLDGPGRILCSSVNGQRVYCDADTKDGVRLVRQLSDFPCDQGTTWGYDSRGIWVDQGCRAEFEVSAIAPSDYGNISSSTPVQEFSLPPDCRLGYDQNQGGQL
jgi:hypothetical protein